MVKIIIGFVVLAAAVLVLLNQGGHVEMGGEHAGQEASMKASEKSEAPAAPAAAAPAAPAAPAKN